MYQLSINELSEEKRIICWFSCGVTSTVAIKKAIEKYKPLGFDIKIFYFYIKTAHEDNKRFLKECENWFGEKINIIYPKFGLKDQFDVIEKTKFINSPAGAECTGKLKKNRRYEIESQYFYTYQVFGFEYERNEINRAVRFIEQNPNSKAIFPLIESKLTKENCLKILMKNNIKIPKMYELGYSNNNCIGCVKGGKGYWNKIRKDFPEIFEKMKSTEIKIGASCLNGTYLKDLNPKAGRNESIKIPDCGNICEIEFSNIESPKVEKIMSDLVNISDYYNYKKEA